MKNGYKRLLAGFVSYLSLLGLFYLVGGVKMASEAAVGIPLAVVFFVSWMYAVW